MGRKIKTMEEFASLSGISRPTLSKFFNDAQSVKESTRLKIEQAIETQLFARVAAYSGTQTNRRHQ